MPILRERTNAEAAFSTSAQPLPPNPSLPSLPSPPSTNPQPLSHLRQLPNPSRSISPLPRPLLALAVDKDLHDIPAGQRGCPRAVRHQNPNPRWAKIWRIGFLKFMGTDN